MTLRLTSDAFAPGQPMPKRYTCEGENLSPPLAIDGVPNAAQSLLLIVDDPDAPNGVFTHWVLYNLPAGQSHIDEGYAPRLEAGPGPAQGRNDFGNDYYDGPCPPPGDEPHHYFFRLYALDEPFTLPAGATRAQVLERVQGHIVAQTELMARCQRGAVPAEQLGQGTRDWNFEFYGEIPHLSTEDQQRLRAEAENRIGVLTQGRRDLVGASVAVEPVAAAQDQTPIRFRARVVAYIRPENLAVSEQDDTAEAALRRALDAVERAVREQRARQREAWQHGEAAPARAES